MADQQLDFDTCVRDYFERHNRSLMVEACVVASAGGPELLLRDLDGDVSQNKRELDAAIDRSNTSGTLVAYRELAEPLEPRGPNRVQVHQFYPKWPVRGDGDEHLAGVLFDHLMTSWRKDHVTRLFFLHAGETPIRVLYSAAKRRYYEKLALQRAADKEPGPAATGVAPTSAAPRPHRPAAKKTTPGALKRATGNVTKKVAKKAAKKAAKKTAKKATRKAAKKATRKAAKKTAKKATKKTAKGRTSSSRTRGR